MKKMSDDEFANLLNQAEGGDQSGQFADDWAAALQEQQAAAQRMANTAAAPVPMPERAEFEDLVNTPVYSNESRGGRDDINLDVLLDIPVTIAMEIGRTKISIRSLMQLTQGSVVELDRLAGEPMDVLVNGTLIAHGEVVVVNEKFGIRLTDVISPTERVRKLR
jgi:flagellar motor switch protein FliN/FliY